jgi:hypothetical protein
LVEAAAGRTLAFAIVSNGHAPRRRERVRAAHEQLVRLVVDYARHLEPAAPVSDEAPLVTRSSTVDVVMPGITPVPATAAVGSSSDAVEIENPEPEEGADPSADLPTAVR